MIDNLLWFLAGSLFGVIAGMAVTVRRIILPDGRVRLRFSTLPFSRAQRVMYFAVGLVAVTGVVMTARTNSANSDLTQAQQEQVDRQQACNNALIEAITARSTLTQEDSANLQRLLSTVGGIVLEPLPPTDSERRQILQVAFAEYLRVRDATQVERLAHPLPSPDCGR